MDKVGVKVLIGIGIVAIGVVAFMSLGRTPSVQEESVAQPVQEVAQLDCGEDIDLAERVGQQVCVEFTVANVEQVDDCHFITDDRYKVYVEGEYWDEWQWADENFLNKEIRVQGEVSLYDGVPEIEILRPDQISFL